MPVYVDNAQNRKLGRVGLEKGKNKPGPKPGNKAKPNKPGAKKPGPKPKPKPTADSKIKIYGEDVLKTFQEKGVLDLVVPLQEQITGGQQAFYVDIANAPEPEIEPEPQLTMLQKKALEKQNFPSNIVKSGGILQSAAEQQVKFGGIIEQKAKDMALLKSFQSPIVAGQSLGSLSEFEIYDNWTMEQEIAAKLGTGPPKPKLPNYNLFFVQEWMRPEKVLTEEEKVLAEAEKDAKDIAKIMAKGQYKYLNPSWKFLKEFEEEGGFFGGDYTQEEDPDKVYESPDSEDFYSSTEEEDSLSEPSEDEPAPESMSDLSDSGEDEPAPEYKLKNPAPAIPSMSIKPAMNTMVIPAPNPPFPEGEWEYYKHKLELKGPSIIYNMRNKPPMNTMTAGFPVIGGISEYSPEGININSKEYRILTFISDFNPFEIDETPQPPASYEDPRYSGGEAGQRALYPETPGGARNLEEKSRVILRQQRRRFDNVPDPYLAVDLREGYKVFRGPSGLQYADTIEQYQNKGLGDKYDWGGSEQGLSYINKTEWMKVMRYSPNYEELYRKLWVDPVPWKLIGAFPLEERAPVFENY